MAIINHQKVLSSQVKLPSFSSAFNPLLHSVPNMGHLL